MDFLDPASPAHDFKLLERDLYLHLWEEYMASAGRILDLGGGIGRFTQWFLARGLEVELVDPDLRSLWRALQHSAGGEGRLDLHWSTAEYLPPMRPFDLVLAAEVLCYVEDPVKALESAWQLLVPGGYLLASVEARYGWVSALDVPGGTLPAFFDDGVVFVPGDRWVRTFQRQEFTELLEPRFEVMEIVPTHYVSGGPFEAAARVGNIREMLRWETRCRSHPMTRQWNRAWTAVARKPA